MANIMDTSLCLCGHTKKEHQTFKVYSSPTLFGCSHDGCKCKQFEFWRDPVVDPPGYDKLPDADKQREIGMALLEAVKERTEQLVCIEKTVEQLRIDIRFYERMLDLGHWTIGDHHIFTKDEIAWFRYQISAVQKQIDSYHIPWYKE
ncbi:MAG: hypothetical protein ACHQUC_09265 [Chlamydiales bacterium]